MKDGHAVGRHKWERFGRDVGFGLAILGGLEQALLRADASGSTATASETGTPSIGHNVGVLNVWALRTVYVLHRR